MFWRRRKNFLMDWTNALHQASGTMTISVGSKKKWKPRLNCSCVCFNTHLFCFLTHLALWLTVNVFLGERCGENSHLKRPLKEHWSVQLQVGKKKHVKLKLILKHCGELHMFMTLFHIIRKLWYDNVSEKIDHGFEYKVLYLEHWLDVSSARHIKENRRTVLSQALCKCVTALTCVAASRRAVRPPLV